jgi:hypothetical protein
MDHSNLAAELRQLKGEVAALRRRNGLLTLLLVLPVSYLLVTGFIGREKDGVFNRVEAREIVVKDRDGKDRILISPRIAASASRIRKDTLEGILILDAGGADRVVLGATPTIQFRGKIIRRAENDFPYGFAFNDASGNERGGLGYYARRGLVSFGMDHPDGAEGIAFFVADDHFYGQQAGMVVNAKSGGQAVYIGASTAGETMVNLDAPQQGRLSLSIDSTAKARVRHFDYGSGWESVLLESN